MFKKRPRAARRTLTDSERPEAPSKTEPDYWRQRLFKNTFTYKRKRVEVNGWSVKIQLFGKRKTFSLSSSDSTQAAAEACRIYQAILAQGWEAVADRRARAGTQPDEPPGQTISPDSLESAGEHWNRRLIHRKLLEPPNSLGDREFSVRIEHARTGVYFPLGTTDEREAAARARRIHQTIVTRGWESANRRFSRELTLALRWLDNPVAWTYITLHTHTRDADPTNSLGSNPGQLVKPVSALSVAVVEPDIGIRRALAACINRQEGFRCGAIFATVAEAVRETPRQQLDFFVMNDTLAQQPAACLEEFQRLKPGLAGLLYSVFEDSDHLFKATPGGAVGYMLKRTAPSRIFEPIAQALRPLTREQMAARVRDYFQRLSASLPAGPPSRELATLTPREHEILALLSKGRLAKEIADTLGISVWTVHGHVKSIFEKLNVHTRTEAVVKFLQK